MTVHDRREQNQTDTVEDVKRNVDPQLNQVHTFEDQPERLPGRFIRNVLSELPKLQEDRLLDYEHQIQQSERYDQEDRAHLEPHARHSSRQTLGDREDTDDRSRTDRERQDQNQLVDIPHQPGRGPKVNEQDQEAESCHDDSGRDPR